MSNWLVLIGLCALIFIQSYGLVLTNIPLRVADPYDLVADAAGALFGLGVYLLSRRRGGRKNTLAPC